MLQNVEKLQLDSVNRKMCIRDRYQEKPKIALTFDDGPHPSSTPVLLDGLAGRNVKATFFVIGENVVKNPKVVSREAEEGHIIGNHTYSHVDLTKMSQEMTRCV